MTWPNDLAFWSHHKDFLYQTLTKTRYVEIESRIAEFDKCRIDRRIELSGEQPSSIVVYLVCGEAGDEVCSASDVCCAVKVVPGI